MGGNSSRLSDVVADQALPAPKTLSGKVVLITGPTAGIGYETARVLAKHGAHVILAARDAKKTEGVKAKLIEEIKKEVPEANPQLTPLALNLSSLTSVRNAAQQFLALGLPLHFLVNNAGIMAVPYTLTEDGYESQIATNHLGHYYLTKLLLPKLRSTATPEFPARIVNLSSMAHMYASIKTPTDLESSFTIPSAKYSHWTAYGNSKLTNILFTRALAKSEASSNIFSFAVHPGVVSTDLSRHNAGAKFFYSVGSVFMKNSNQGASTTIFTLLKSPKEDSGKYFADNAVGKPSSAAATDDKLTEKLIELSEKYIAEFEAKHPASATSSASSSS